MAQPVKTSRLTKQQRLQAVHRQKIAVLFILIMMLYVFLYVTLNVSNTFGLLFGPVYFVTLVPLLVGSVGVAYGIVPVIKGLADERRIVIALTSFFVFVLSSLIFFIIDLNLAAIRL